MIKKHLSLKGSLILMGLFASLGYIINSCKPENPLNGINIVTNSDLIKTSYAIELENAATGDPVILPAGKKVKITIQGQNKDLVVDAAGVNKTSFSVADGLVAIGIQPGVVPTETSPVQFTLVVEAEGYVTTSYPVSITEQEKDIINIQMVEIANPPAGVVAATATGSATSSGTTAPISVTTATASGSNTTATVTIPAGTIIRDANNTPLTGALTATVVYSNSESEGSISTFPGGLAATAMVNGVAEDVYFTTAGYVSVEITNSAGLKAQNFNSGTIKTSMTLAPNTDNPQTGDKIKAGDSIPVWSYEPGTGLWTREGASVVVDNGGTLEISQDVSHLSYWNFCWKGPRCKKGASLTFTTSTGSTAPKPIIVKAFSSSGKLLKSERRYIIPGDVNRLRNVPSASGINLKVYDASACSGNTLLGEATVDLCSGNYTIPLTYANATVVKMKVSGYCKSNPSVLVKPSVWAYYRDLNSNCPNRRKHIYVLNGEAHAEMALGHQYEFTVYYDGQKFQTTQVVNQMEFIYENIALPADACK